MNAKGSFCSFRGMNYLMLLKILRKILALDGVASIKTPNLVNCSIIHKMQISHIFTYHRLAYCRTVVTDRPNSVRTQLSHNLSAVDRLKLLKLLLNLHAAVLRNHAFTCIL